jgi:hypothetical protein
LDRVKLKQAKGRAMEVLARWESLRRKHFVEAVRLDDGRFGFRADASGGSGYATAEEAIKRAELEASFYNVRMRRTI